MKKFVLGTMVFLVMTFVFITMARSEYKEGQWSMTIRTKMDNMPPEMAKAYQQMQNMSPEVKAMLKEKGLDVEANGQGMTTTVTHCMTKQNPVPKYTKNPNEDYCQQTHEINDDTVTFHMTCDHNDFQMDSSGTMTYLGDSMQGHIKSHTVKAGKTMDATVDITGQYLGPC